MLTKKGGIWDDARRRIQDGGCSGGFQSDGISALKIWLEQAFLKFGVLETCEGIFEEGTDNIYFAYNDLSLFIVSLRCIKSADMDSTCKCFLLIFTSVSLYYYQNQLFIASCNFMNFITLVGIKI